MTPHPGAPGAQGHPLVTCTPCLWKEGVCSWTVWSHTPTKRTGSVQSDQKQTQRKQWCSSKPTRFQGTLPLLFAGPPLVAFCKHLLAHIFVSTIAFLTVNFRMSSQDKGLCEQTEILIVAFCLAECSPSNICLCDTQGLPRAVGCPFAAHPRLGDAHQWDILPSHLAAALAAAPKLTSFGVPWQACMHGFGLAAVLGSCALVLFTHHSQTT